MTGGWEKQKIVGKEAAIPRFHQQLIILKSAKGRFESSLFDIKQLLQSDLFDSELEAAKELNNKGFTRGAGAVAKHHIRTQRDRLGGDQDLNCQHDLAVVFDSRGETKRKIASAWSSGSTGSTTGHQLQKSC